MGEAVDEVRRSLRRVVKRYDKAGEPLPTEIARLCEQYEVSPTYEKPKKAAAKKSGSKKK